MLQFAPWLRWVVAASLMAGTCNSADLVIRIPGDPSQQDGFYRLDYRRIIN